MAGSAAAGGGTGSRRESGKGKGPMFGAILGDIAGSRFEFSRPQTFNYKKEPFFTDACCFTDDTVLTVATKYAVLNGCSYRNAYLEFGRKFPLAGYGSMFKRWLL